MKKKYWSIFLLIFVATIFLGGCGSNMVNSTSNDVKVINTKEDKANIEYGLIIDNSKYMKLILKNNTDKKFELVWPTTHTFNFKLYKNDDLIWDFYKDDKSRSELRWETHITLLADRQFEQQIWFENMPKNLNGTYTYEFYYIGGQLKDIPQLKGTLELVSGQDGICRSKKLKLHMN